MIRIFKFRANDLNPSNGKQIEFSSKTIQDFFEFHDAEVTVVFIYKGLTKKELFYDKRISSTLKQSPERGDYKIYRNTNNTQCLKDFLLESLQLSSEVNKDDFFALERVELNVYNFYYIPSTTTATEIYMFLKDKNFDNSSDDNVQEELSKSMNDILAVGARQLIKYGAPGTGKSNDIEEIVKEYDDTVRTTFHPDSDYATFVGCYKPTMVTQIKYGLQGEPIKKDGKEISEDVITYSFVPQAFTDAYTRAWQKMASPEDGKILPQFLIIEEINRGNCAQIFGDLFQLLDRDGQGYSKYAIEADADLAKHIAKELSTAGGNIPDTIRSGKILKLPPNLFIWATMNTSDQSLFPMDSAFKRRWEWEYIPIKDAGKAWKILVDGEEFLWWEFINTINEQILETLKNEDKQLGYFFARPMDDMSDTIAVSTFVNKVLFYLYNDVFKDYDLPAGFVKPEKEGGKFAFRDFFLSDGKPDEKNVKALLSGLLKKQQ